MHYNAVNYTALLKQHSFVHLASCIPVIIILVLSLCSPMSNTNTSNSIFGCNSVEEIHAFLCMMNPPILGYKKPQRTQLYHDVGCLFCFFAFYLKKLVFFLKKYIKLPF